MNKYIKGIIVFKDNKEKSLIEFDEGINIIVGESKTGKSALIDIIDYCLCSKRNTIPIGVITNYAKLYVLILKVDERYLVIARIPENDNMAINIIYEELDINNIKIEDFPSFSKVKDIQQRIEDELGLKVSNIFTSSYIDYNKGKASLRNMVSYNFQHQNNMANKFSLFYRFNDSEKRHQIIEQFPIFAGIVNQEYYSTLVDLKDSQTKLKILLHRKENEAKLHSKLCSELYLLVGEYYALLGEKIPVNINDYSIPDLLNFAKKLPQNQLNFIDETIVDSYNKIKEESSKYYDEIIQIELKLKTLQDSNKDVIDYTNLLNDVENVTDVSNSNVLNFKCPLCDAQLEHMNSFKQELIENKNWIKAEKKFAENTNNHFVEEKRKINNLLNSKKKEYRRMLKEIIYIEDHYLNNSKLRDISEKISNAKLRIDYFIEVLSDEKHSEIDKEINELNNHISELNEVIKVYNLDKEMKKISEEIDKNMNKLAIDLDFEEEHKPINLHFDLKTFDLYHTDIKGQKIYLSEMGSGANWLSCHIALFLSLLRVFTARNTKTPMLLFLFFDQPSQVYFPNYVKGHDYETKDLKSISRIFKTIFEEYISIKNETGIMPQLILTEHVSGKNLQYISSKYELYTKKEWVNGKKYIDNNSN